MKTNFFPSNLLLSVLFILILSVTVQSELIILNFRQTPLNNVNSNNEELLLCALKKSFVGNNDNNIAYKFLNLNNENGCSPLTPPIDPLYNQSAVYVHVPKMSCSFSKMADNLQANNPKLVLVASDGPIVKF